MSHGLSLAGEGLRRSYRRSRFSLDVPTLSVAAGRTLALLGPSGSGKSTLLHLLGLLDKPDAGNVILDGRVVTAADADARMSIAAVFQRPYLFKGSVAANVAYGLDVRGIRGAEKAARVSSALDRVGLAGYENRSAHGLSGGEAQRVSLARALVIEPRVLLLDEPLAALDPLLKRRLTRDFASILRGEGVTVVYVTHDQDEALVVADEIAVMNEGRVVAWGGADEVMGLAEDDWTAAFLGVEPAAPAIVAAEGDGVFAAHAGEAHVTVAGTASIGDRVLLSVRPEDVLLFESGAELPLTSARNRLDATVTSVEPRGSTLRITLDASGMRLAASVSRGSVAELHLEPGRPVLAVFKATAVRWRLAEPPQRYTGIPADKTDATLEESGQ